MPCLIFGDSQEVWVGDSLAVKYCTLVMLFLFNSIQSTLLHAFQELRVRFFIILFLLSGQQASDAAEGTGK